MTLHTDTMYRLLHLMHSRIPPVAPGDPGSNWPRERPGESGCAQHGLLEVTRGEWTVPGPRSRGNSTKGERIAQLTHAPVNDRLSKAQDQQKRIPTPTFGASQGLGAGASRYRRGPVPHHARGRPGLRPGRRSCSGPSRIRAHPETPVRQPNQGEGNQCRPTTTAVG